MIDLFRPFVPKEARENVEDVLRSRFIGQGPKVEEFEKVFETQFLIRDQHAIAVNSGTSALETAYDLLELKSGDEVITTPLTCTATNIPLLRRGVKIVWADICENTLCINPLDVRSKITDRTKAIVQVHLGGIKADCGFSHIPVISDACQALGIFNGDMSCFSFQAIKHITTGDGGMLVVRGGEMARKAKLLRWFGIDREKKIKNNWQAYQYRKMTFDIELPGLKRQMTDIAAAMGLAGLKYYLYMMHSRSAQFEIYRERLKEIDGISLIDSDVNTYWLCTVLVDRRDDFAKMLFEADVDTNVVQVRNDIYKIFGGKRADLPVMNKVEHKYLSLPLGPHLRPEDIHYVCDKIKGGW
jgi:perosamine synthetase